MPKTPQDEAELAQLQTKQQQILATGRPVQQTTQQPQVGAQIPTVISPQPTNALSNQVHDPRRNCRSCVFLRSTTACLILSVFVV